MTIDRPRALSLTQPWAYAITHLGKRIENRAAWKGCSYRGPIWIHASATAGSAFDDCAEGLRETLLLHGRASDWDAFLATHLKVTTGGRYAANDKLPMGAIVGHAHIVDVIANERDFIQWQQEGANAHDRAERMCQRAWWFGGFALVLDEVTAIEPVTCKGALGLWTVPADVVALLPTTPRGGMER